MNKKVFVGICGVVIGFIFFWLMASWSGNAFGLALFIPLLGAFSILAVGVYQLMTEKNKPKKQSLIGVVISSLFISYFVFFMFT